MKLTLIFLITVFSFFAFSNYESLLHKQAYLQCKVVKLKVAGDLSLPIVKDIKKNCIAEADEKEKAWDAKKKLAACEWRPCRKHSQDVATDKCLPNWLKSSKQHDLPDCLMGVLNDACADTFASLDGQRPRKILWKHGSDEGYWFCSPKVK